MMAREVLVRVRHVKKSRERRSWRALERWIWTCGRRTKQSRHEQAGAGVTGIVWRVPASSILWPEVVMTITPDGRWWSEEHALVCWN